jgi:cation diffusion facilitator CzcD-associated flavoprotein CzcO
VLVVGAANSGTDIALEAVKTHRTLLAGRQPGQVSVDIDSAAASRASTGTLDSSSDISVAGRPRGRYLWTAGSITR